MAIKDMKGTVTTTGIMNRRPEPLKVADMSKMKMPTNRNVNTPKEPPQEIKQQPKQIEEPNLLSKIENLTDQDKAVLGTVLSPSVSKVLSKIAPDIQPLLNQFTKEEENVVLPVSIVFSLVEILFSPAFSKLPKADTLFIPAYKSVAGLPPILPSPLSVK